MPYELSSESLIPDEEVKYEIMKNFSDWKDSAFNPITSNTVVIEDVEKIQTIIEFSRKVLADSTDIDNEYVDIVNENFWDLI